MKTNFDTSDMRNSLASTVIRNLRTYADRLEEWAYEIGTTPDLVGLKLATLVPQIADTLDDRAHTCSIDLCGCNHCNIELQILYGVNGKQVVY